MIFLDFITKFKTLQNAESAIAAAHLAVQQPATWNTTATRTFLIALGHHQRAGNLDAPDLGSLWDLVDADMRSRIHAVLLRAPYSRSFGI